jgi:Domain of unknown function (DUF4276)
MVRIGISVEGSTEERFIDILLVPHLVTHGIYATPIPMNGNISVERIKNELKNLMHSFDYTTTFYDFYGFKHKEDFETKISLETKIHASVSENLRRRLIPYIQMYEFEGLLFSSPNVIASNLQGNSLDQWATGILQEFNNNPETVNNSKETAPSKRLEKWTNYRKTTHGPNIAKEIGLERIRSMCSGFNDWLTKIESLR